MIYFIYFLGAFILLTLVFILVVGKYVFDLQVEKTFSPYGISPPIIERAYRGVDFRYSFQYQKEESLRHNIFNPNVMIIDDGDHKEYIIRDAVRKIADNLLENGCIEVNEETEKHYPHYKRVTLKVKVYKPEQ